MGEMLGLVGDQPLAVNQEKLSEDMASSMTRTAWGLFQIDT